MNTSAQNQIRKFQLNGERGLLKGSRKGLEKESLRVAPDGTIAGTPHPQALGSKLCHPSITTDYSEALLEFITPPYQNVTQTVDYLTDLHRFAYHNIGDELLWATSMPCIVGGDASIPIADYGHSNVGRMKTVYRHGLDWRYGRAMQAIAGIHFNYSFSDEFFAALQAANGDRSEPGTFRSEAYLGLIRNFQRYGWIVPYLFGASPAICKSFTHGENIHFRDFDASTFYEPWGTSLRMSDIGYKNNAQAGLSISYNDLDTYVDNLTRAISTPDSEYARIGTQVNGEWRQLNTNVLQIENEYYSFVRPKAVARSGERPTTALKRAGVEYIEIRALDLNPFEPVGVSVQQLHFMEVLLLFCLMQDSPPIDAREQGHINCNQGLVARQGRKPNLALYRSDGRKQTVYEWATELCERLIEPAELLDELSEGSLYSDALAAYRQRVDDPDLTPSARVLAEMRKHGEAFVEFAMRVSRQHETAFKAETLPAGLAREMARTAYQSLEEQRAIEDADELSFEDYVARYFDAPS